MQIQLSLGRFGPLLSVLRRVMNYTSFYYRGYVNLEVDYSSQLTVLIVG